MPPSIETDYENFIIMGVSFGSVDSFDAAIGALGTVMYEDLF